MIRFLAAHFHEVSQTETPMRDLRVYCSQRKLTDNPDSTISRILTVAATYLTAE